MTLDPPTMSAYLAVAASVGSLCVWIMKNTARLAKMEVKVDTVWDFLMRRAVSEAINVGVAVKNSPIEVTDEAKQWMKPLLASIRDFYRETGGNLTDRELALEIERRFGEQILNEVCIPHRLSQGACLLIAIQAAVDEKIKSCLSGCHTQTLRPTRC